MIESLDILARRQGLSEFISRNGRQYQSSHAQEPRFVTFGLEVSWPF
jgi:hypothetical protein